MKNRIDIGYSPYLDFVIEVERGRNIRLLQLTDTQIIDGSQKRTPNRLQPAENIDWVPEMMRENLFDEIDRLVTLVEPDLILITGDIIYGEFDDAGTSLLKLIAVMDGYGIPWAPVFGNHENESVKGVDWQVEQLIRAEHCLFKRGNVTGNGNYNIGIVQNGALVRTVYMLDSNGCGYIPDINIGKVESAAGFADDQIAWVENRMSNIERVCGGKVPSFVGFHIPMAHFAAAKAQYTTLNTFTIGETFPAKNGDFGGAQNNETIEGQFESPKIHEILIRYGTDGVFAGHFHCNNTSIYHGGIRWTFGLKTGVYDSHPRHTGGVYIEVAEGGASFACEQIKYNRSECL